MVVSQTFEVAMKTIALIFSLFCFLNATHAQTNSSTMKIYNVKIYCHGIKKPIKGIFYTYSDSTISIINTKSITAISNGSFERVDYLINDIIALQVRRKGKIVSSTLIGGLFGGVSGALIGLASGDDDPGLVSFSAEQKAGMLAVPLAVIGSGIGAIGGSVYTDIPIKGEPDSIALYQETLDKYSIIKKDKDAFN